MSMAGIAADFQSFVNEHGTKLYLEDLEKVVLPFLHKARRYGMQQAATLLHAKLDAHIRNGGAHTTAAIETETCIGLIEQKVSK